MQISLGSVFQPLLWHLLFSSKIKLLHIHNIHCTFWLCDRCHNHYFCLWQVIFSKTWTITLDVLPWAWILFVWTHRNGTGSPIWTGSYLFYSDGLCQWDWTDWLQFCHVQRCMCFGLQKLEFQVLSSLLSWKEWIVSKFL